MQDRLDVAPLELREGDRRRAGRGRGCHALRLERDGAGTNDGAVRQQHDPLDDVLQLAHVAGPAVPGEHLERVRRERGWLRLPVLSQELSGDEGDVDRAVAQRGQLDLDRVDAVQQVIAELPVGDAPREVPIRGREDADVDLHLLRAANAVEAALVERAQELALKLERQLRDLVEEERAAGGELHEAELPLFRAGKCAALMPKELALEHAFAERRTTHVDERPRASAEPVQHRCDELLAGARLAGDEYRAVARRDLRDDVEDRLQRRILRRDLVLAARALEL